MSKKKKAIAVKQSKKKTIVTVSVDNFINNKRWQNKQEIWANAHETRDSISLISFAGCLGLSRDFFSLSKCVRQRQIAKKIIKNPYFWGSRSFKVIDHGTPESSKACYDTQHVCVYMQPFSC